MKRVFPLGLRLVLLAAVLAAGVVASAGAGRDAPPGGKLDFSRDVRRILSDKCFKCHGPDPKNQKADLRLDSFEAATKGGKSGKAAIVPGKPGRSEAVRRIFLDDPEKMMPPPENKNPLTEEQKEVLKRWVAEGAEYKPHWAFIPPQKPSLPRVGQQVRNPVDAFILARLEKEGLKSSREADRYTLVRRVYLDLIGLPPTPAEADAFVRDSNPSAYERMVDRLLDSPAYGERWSRPWLDLARYGDTNGYEKDRPRMMWPYRDWVINAFNRDMPFDEFTIEQIAGDMLPNATRDHVIATGFHRNTMTNEEGGIDPMEFRFYNLVDRVGTTGTVWLGLTVQCTQCHTHKYDPLKQSEFYGMMAFFDQADEPKVDVIRAEAAARREAAENQAEQLEATLAERFPLPEPTIWTAVKPGAVTSVGGSTFKVNDDASILVTGTSPETDAYTFTVDGDLAGVTQIRVEALTDPSLPNTGPGRAGGNFVLTEFTATIGAVGSGEPAKPLKFVRAGADFSQKDFDASGAIDGQPKTGWAIAGDGKWNTDRAATFHLDGPITATGPTRLTVALDQRYGGKHTLGRFRVSVGRPNPLEDPAKPERVRRREHLEQKYAAWLAGAERRAVSWTVLKPTQMKTALAFMDLLPDGSVLVSGDQTKLDVYDVTYENPGLSKITAVRLEALPDPSLPEGGPGRVWYEGTFGDFYLSDMKLSADGKAVKWGTAAQDFANAANTAMGVIDDRTDSGWSITGAVGREHRAVFTLAQPVEGAKSLAVKMTFERWYAAALGRFRISVTDRAVAAPAADLPGEIEAILTMPAARRTAAQQKKLLDHFLAVAPELGGERAKVEELRKKEPPYPTTLVMHQRGPDRYRQTFVHTRGEFLKPADPVKPGVPEVLHPLAKGDRAPNRLDFARWIVDRRNPVVARVTVNRHWAIFFGRGIVKTVDDFGVQGEMPTHPELLDWLAVDFMRDWSLKRLHRTIVTSATYRQSSAATEEHQKADPENKLLARGPRFRLEAELIRDSTLVASALLTRRIGGPSVMPPQPGGITEATYGPLKWEVATREDRYRRGLYTFQKRTAPFAMFSLFGAPSGEQCEARRVRSNTPLQALTMLNDGAFVEAARAMAHNVVIGRHADDAERATALFRAILVRPPTEKERGDVLAFYQRQAERFRGEPSLAGQVCGREGARPEEGAWTAVARVIMNLDEAITKE